MEFLINTYKENNIQIHTKFLEKNLSIFFLFTLCKINFFK